jgi:hypothetical protein
MDTLPLPPRPDLSQYRKRAKELVAAANSEDEAALRAWSAGWLDALAGLARVAATPFVQSSLDRAVGGFEQRAREKIAQPRARFVLADAQFLVAKAHGFANWGEFARHVERLSGDTGEGDPFETAADAVVGGDLDVLASLLQTHPGLIHARSARVHRATLLHYVAPRRRR